MAQQTRNANIALNRSCEACRARKVKCLVTSDRCLDSMQQCDRCSYLSLTCTFLAPIKRKKRRRNETRIQELEKKLSEIEGTFVGNYIRGESVIQQPPDSLAPALHSLASEDSLQCPSGSRASGDAVSCGLLDEDIAQILFERFRNDIARTYPIVKLPPHKDYKCTRMREPALFGAILSAASSSIDAYLFQSLFNHTATLLATAIVVHGRKSLELIQALLIMATWHHPTERFDELKFNQYTHMAAAMVVDLRFSNDESYAIPRQGDEEFSSRTMESCRTFVACYFLCSSISVTLRRQNQLGYGQWLEDSMAYLAKYADKEGDDLQLIQFTTLQRIAEEAFAVVGLDQGQNVDCSDAHARCMLSSYIERVIRWRQSLSTPLVAAPLEIHYNVVLTNLCEPALHGKYDITDTRPPYRLYLEEKSLEDEGFQVYQTLDLCVTSAEVIVGTFLSLSTDTLRSVPVIIYARMAYAIVVLIKIDLMTSNGRNLAACFVQTALPSINKLLSDLIEKLEVVRGVEQLQVPATFQNFLDRIVKWYAETAGKCASISSSDTTEAMFEPMKLLGLGGTISPRRTSSPSTPRQLTTAGAAFNGNIFEGISDIAQNQSIGLTTIGDVFDEERLDGIFDFGGSAAV